MPEEEYNKENQETIKTDLDKQSFEISSQNGIDTETDKEKLYKDEKKRVERAVEQSGERLKQGSTTVSDDDDQPAEKQTIDLHAKEIVSMDAKDQIVHLVQIAATKDPYLAVKIAKHLEDNYVLAELHSDLTEDKVRKILLEKGFL